MAWKNFCLLLLCLFLVFKAFGVTPPSKCDPSKGIGLSGYLVQQNGHPTPELRNILQRFNLDTPASLSKIAEVTQREWLRPKGTERWQIHERYDSQRIELVPYFEKLGMLCEKEPAKERYEHALLLGGLLSRVRIRLAYLAQQWRKGVRFNSIVLLGSDRTLDSKLECPQFLLSRDPILPTGKDWKTPTELPTNEIDMMKFVFAQADLPEGMRRTRLVIVTAPHKRDRDGNITRATTEDTLLAWYNAKPSTGKVLLLSNQPFIGYQHAKATKCLPTAYELETVGPALERSDAKIGVLLDTLARWINELAH